MHQKIRVCKDRPVAKRGGGGLLFFFGARKTKSRTPMRRPRRRTRWSVSFRARLIALQESGQKSLTSLRLGPPLRHLAGGLPDRPGLSFDRKGLRLHACSGSGAEMLRATINFLRCVSSDSFRGGAGGGAVRDKGQENGRVSLDQPDNRRHLAESSIRCGYLCPVMSFERSGERPRMPSPSGGKSGAASQFPEGMSHPPI